MSLKSSWAKSQRTTKHSKRIKTEKRSLRSRQFIAVAADESTKTGVWKLDLLKKKIFFSLRYLNFCARHSVWNSSKMSHFSVSICVIFTNFCLVTLFDHKLQAFNNSPKWTIFGICNQLFSAQNVKVARFARNVECDFFCDIQTQCEEMQFWHFF